MRRKFDNFVFGILSALVLPPLSFFIFCFFALPGENALEILSGYAKRNVLTHVISLSVLINLALFFIFLNMQCEKSARGVIGSTFFYAFLVLILKLL